MIPFNYLAILISIVLALGMTRLLYGVGEMLQARSHRHLYWVHAVWVVNLFILLVSAWWVFYRWRTQAPWTFFLFVFVLIPPTILFLASVVLFPREGTPDKLLNYKTHFYANHRAFFIIMVLYAPADLADTLLKGVHHFFDLGPQYVILWLLYSTGLTVAAITRNEHYHQFYSLFFFAQEVTFSFVLFRTLE